MKTIVKAGYIILFMSFVAENTSPTKEEISKQNYYYFFV